MCYNIPVKAIEQQFRVVFLFQYFYTEILSMEFFETVMVKIIVIVMKTSERLIAIYRVKTMYFSFRQ